VRIPALVSDSALLQGSENILLGTDVLHKKIGFIAQCDNTFTWWTKQEEQEFPHQSILETTHGFVGRGNDCNVTDVARANTSNDHLSQLYSVPDNTIMGISQTTLVGPPGEVGDQFPTSGSQNSINLTSNAASVVRGLEESTITDDRALLVDSASEGSQSMKRRNNPKKRVRSSKRRHHTLNKNKRQNRKSRKSLDRKSRKLLNKERKNLLKKENGEFIIPRYPISDIPLPKDNNDIIALVQCTIRHNAPLFPQSSLINEEVVAAIQMQAVNPGTSNVIDWQDLPERREIFIHHKIT